MPSIRERLLRLALRHVPLMLFAAIFIGFGVFSPRFLSYESIENIVTQASYIGILAAGMTFVLLTGGIDLSVGSNMYVSAATAGLLIRDAGAPVWAAFAACLLVGLAFGAANALAVARLRIAPFVVTLATWMAGRGLGWMLTGSEQVNFPASVTSIGSQELLGLVPYPIVIFAVVVAVAWVFLNCTPQGRQIYAVGHDMAAARKAGIDTEHVQAGAYILCGLCAALGGFVCVAQLGNINAGFGKDVEFEAIAAAVLGGASLFGGVGSVFPGTVLGAIMIRMIATGLVSAKVELYVQPLAAAGILFMAVLLDSVRKGQLARMNRRTICVEEPER